MGKLLNAAFFAGASVGRRVFTARTRNTPNVQARFLRQFVQHHRDTALGASLSLHQVNNAKAFEARIPALPYDAYEPYVNRVARGEANVMTPDPVIFLTVTTGTTGPRKLIPVTRRSYRFRNRARRASVGFVAQAMQKRGLGVGPALVTNGAALMGHTSAGIPFGMASACDLNLNRRSYRGRDLFPYPFDVLSLEDGTSRHYLCLLFALRTPDLAVVTGNFPPYVLQTAGLLERFRVSLLDDIANGTIADWVAMPDELRARLCRLHSPAYERAKALDDTARARGYLAACDAWSNLSAIVTARGAPSHFYFRQFGTQFDNTPVFGGIYGSSEAIFGVYPDFDTDEAVLAVDTAYFEFVPESEWGKAHPAVIAPVDVIPGQHYRVLITNYSGLVRYDIGDVVKVLGFYEGAPTLTFIRRHGGQLSSLSEKTTEYHVDQVVQRLEREFGADVADYCVSLGDNASPPPYVVNVEFAHGSRAVEPLRFIQRFDEVLSDENFLYGARRREFLPAPRLRILTPGSFAAMRARRADAPGTDTNIKLQHIAPDSDYTKGTQALIELSDYEPNWGANREADPKVAAANTP